VSQHRRIDLGDSRAVAPTRAAMSSRDPAPWKVEDLAKPPEADPGREVQFCPILGLPIVPALRVRALPGFHLLSLDAGKEAIARGFYVAFGDKFPCHNLEYLHPDDKVFICTEDNKAFLNEMSMRYHRYIGHELMVRKAERKRMRDRAEELKVRRRQQLAAVAPAEPPMQTQELPQKRRRQFSQDSAPSAVAAPAVADPYQSATEDSFVAPAAAAADPYLAATETVEAAPAPAPAADLAAPVAVATPSPAVAAPHSPPVPSVAAPLAAAPAAHADDDMYEEMGSAQPPKSSSAYANAIGAMLGDDFDDED